MKGDLEIMKNFKKIAAFGIAAAMTMSMGVSAFAEVTASSTDAKFGSYTGGVAKLANVAMIDTTNQWTVVIIDKDKENANLTADDLYYINQGTGSENFWVTNGMGTKVDLTTLVSESAPTKNFIIRIGGETISDTTGIIEIPFTINYNSGEVTWTYGDVNGDGSVDLDDAMEILYYDAFMDSVFDDGEEWRISAGNVTFESGDDVVDLDDAMEVLYYDAFMDSVLDHLLS